MHQYVLLLESFYEFLEATAIQPLDQHQLVQHELEHAPTLQKTPYVSMSFQVHIQEYLHSQYQVLAQSPHSQHEGQNEMTGPKPGH